MAGELRRLTRCEAELVSVAVGVAGGEGDGDEHDADVHDHSAVGPPDQSPPSLTAGRQHQLAHGRAGGERPQPEGGEGCETAQTRGHAQHDDERRHGRRPEQPAPQEVLGRLPPRQHRGHRHQEQEDDDDRRCHPVEVRTSDRQAVAVDRLGQQREHRAEQDDEAEGGEQQVVGEEGALTRDRRVDRPRRPQAVAPPSDQHHRDEDDESEEREDPRPDRRLGERVHGVEHARARQERAEDRQ